MTSRFGLTDWKSGSSGLRPADGLRYTDRSLPLSLPPNHPPKKRKPIRSILLFDVIFCSIWHRIMGWNESPAVRSSPHEGSAPADSWHKAPQEPEPALERSEGVPRPAAALKRKVIPGRLPGETLATPALRWAILCIWKRCSPVIISLKRISYRRLAKTKSVTY